MSRANKRYVSPPGGPDLRMSKITRQTLRRIVHLCSQAPSGSNKDEIETLKEELQDLLCMENVDLKHPRTNSSIPICEACRAGNEWAVEVLLSHGAAVDVYDKNKRSPVYIAASHGHSSILEMLLKQNANINTMNLQGYHPLMSAVENSHLEVADMLIEAGADVNILRPNTFGVTMSLMTFVLFAKNDIPFAKKLLEAGVSPHVFEPPLTFIMLETGDDCREFIKRLVFAGFNFYCEGWIKMCRNKMKAEIAELTEHEKNMIEFLEHEHSNPPSLQRLCRTTTRAALVVSRVVCHIQYKVEKLPLPTNIKKYLLLQHL